MTVPARYTLTEAHFRIAELEGRVAEQDAEIQRLTEERDVARDQRDAWQEVAEDAEAELERLRRHPDAWSQGAFDQQKQRAEAAEAREQRLTEGLRETADELASRRGMIDRAVAAEKFRALLAASPDGANTEGGEA